VSNIYGSYFNRRIRQSQKSDREYSQSNVVNFNCCHNSVCVACGCHDSANSLIDRKDVWGEAADSIPARAKTLDTNSHTTTTMSNTKNSKPWRNYDKPDQDTLKDKLAREVYEVTQEDSTESAYQNELWDEKREGIYVDVLSGEPLFSSKNKYESGTGWPSSTKPLEAENIVTEADHLLGYRRTEVRSRYGDNHLGHVFDDGPETDEAAEGAEPTGLRYCLNSKALEFIPKDEMAERGYKSYLSLFSNDD